MPKVKSVDLKHSWNTIHKYRNNTHGTIDTIGIFICLMKYLEFGDYEREKINEVHATGYIIGIFICLI